MSLGRAAMCHCSVALHAALRSAVAGVGPDLLFLAMQQVSDLLHVSFVGGRVVTCAPGRCRRPRRCAPSCRSTTGCPSWSGASRGRAGLRVLRGAGRRDDRGIDDAAALSSKALARRCALTCLRMSSARSFSSSMCRNSGSSSRRDRLAQLQHAKCAARLSHTVPLHRRFAQREPVLHQVHPQHRFERIRLRPRPATGRTAR